MDSHRLGVGLFGHNGHQLQHHLGNHPRARLVATADLPETNLPETLRADAGIRRHATLDDLLKDDAVELVSLCSARRSEQAEHAIRCLEAGKHVYAEKPCAMSEADLDAILATAKRTGKRFHEMAGTAFDQPYLTMRQRIARGDIGEVVQVFAQKSYPLHDRRPQDETIDGGLHLQVGVHALRMIEHIGGQRITSLRMERTQLGNPGDGGLHIACSFQMRLANGGLASAICNYLNQPLFPRWGNETVRVFGTQGFIESTDGGERTRLVTHERDHGPFPLNGPGLHYHDLIFDSILDGVAMPLNLDAELHPLRVLLTAD